MDKYGYTPAHIMGLWDCKLKREGQREGKPEEPVEDSSKEEKPTPHVTEAELEERVKPTYREKVEGNKRQLSLF